MTYLVRPVPSGYEAVHTSAQGEQSLGIYNVPVRARQACEAHDPGINLTQWEETSEGQWENPGNGILVDDRPHITDIVPYEHRSVDLSGAWCAEPDGAHAMDYVWKILAYYARWNCPEEITAVASWVMHTWCDYAGSGVNGGDGRLCFAASPRLLFVGEQNTGKSRKEQLIRALVRNPTGRVSGIVTAYGVRNVLNLGQTVILDEAQRYFGAGRGKEDLQGIIAGGYIHDGVSLTGKQGKDEQSIFGPICLAAKPEIMTMTNDMLTDLFSRCFIIYTQEWEPTPEDPGIPDLDDQFEFRAAEVRTLLGAWAAYHRPPASRRLWAIHTIPETLTTRNREISQTLFAVADRATDPELTAHGGVDLRWAVATRDAVMKVLAGNLAGPSSDRFDSLGMDDMLNAVRGEHMH